MADSPAERVISVTAQKIREAFNSAQYYQRLRSGEFNARQHDYNRHLSRRSAKKLGEKYCLRSQLLSYYDDTGQKIAVVHLYRRQDGTLGASGAHDPKWLLVGDEIWVTTEDQP